MANLTTTDLDNGKTDLETLSTVVNSQAETTTVTRLGDTVKTLSGLTDEFEQAIINSGYQVLGSFASGVTITSINQLLDYDGGLYRTTESLPYTTDGATPDLDSGEWVVVSDGVLSGIARSLNVLDSEVVYSTDTTTVLDGVLYIYDESEQAIFRKDDSVGLGETIVSVVGGVLTTNISTYDLYSLSSGFIEATSTQLESVIPLDGEAWLNTTYSAVVVGDGVTIGGVKSVNVNTIYKYSDIIVNTVSELINSNFEIGTVVKTKGYYSVGDGGASSYLIAANQIVDGFGDHLLINGNSALIQGEDLDVRQQGARCDGISDDRDAIFAADAADQMNIRSGACLISSSLTFTNVAKINEGVQISVDGGSAITFNEQPKISGLSTVFTGGGDVFGIKDVYPEWWGASSVTDSSSAILSAFLCATATTSGATLHIGDYLIGQTVSLTLSTTTPITFRTYGDNIAGSRLTCSDSFSGTIAIIIRPEDGSNILSFSFDGPGITIANNAAKSVLVGVQFGADNVQMSALTRNRINGISTEGFPVAGIDVVNSRLLTFNGCSTWGITGGTNNGARIRTSGTISGLFCGDTDFNECQFEPKGAGLALYIHSNAIEGQIKGIRFNGQALYNSESGYQLSILADNSSAIGDVWFNPGCQFDGFSNGFMTIDASGSTSVIDDIHFDHVYFRGATQGSSIYVHTTNSGTVQGVFFDSCWIANGSGIFNFDSVDGFSVNNCTFHDISTSGNVIDISNCTGFSLANNKATRSSGANFDKFVRISGNSDYYTAITTNGNGIPITAIIDDAGVGTNKHISLNL